MSRILKSYLKRLTNLSSRNKSLLLPRLITEQFADLHATDFLLNTPSFEILQQVIQRRTRIALCDVADPRYEKVNLLSRTLRKIARTEAFITEERGSRDLYVGYPFVRGKFTNGAVVHAPLLFFPVTLKMDREQWCLSCRNDVGVVLNRAFALAYAQFNETRIPDSILETVFEDFPTHATLFRTELYKWLKESPFQVNFNQELFEDKLRSFDALKGSELELQEKAGELKLYPEAVLGIFPQSGSYLEPDYHYLIGQDSVPLAQVNPEPAPGVVKEELLLTPFPLDLSQEKAVRAVKQGQSLVVQGPPGTGKSQLICNLMADFAAQGKKVLLVCQKRAALDVVYQRLQDAGLGGFAALIHDYKNDRPALYQQIAGQAQGVEAYRKENYSLDAVFIEREYYRECRQIDQAVEALEAFRQALSDEELAGVSIKELYLTSRADAQAIPLNDILKAFPMERAEAFKRRLQYFMAYWLRITPEHTWYRRRDFSCFKQVDYQRMEELLAEWPAFYGRQQQEFREITARHLEKSFFTYFDVLTENIAQASALLQDPVVFELFRAYNRVPADNSARIRFIRKTIQALQARDGFETQLSADRLLPFQQQLAGVIRRKESFVYGLLWEWFGEDREEIRRIGAKKGLNTHPEDLMKLNQFIQNRLDLEEWFRNPLLRFDRKYIRSGAEYADAHLAFLQKAAQASEVVQLFQVAQPLFAQLTEATADKKHLLQKLDQLSAWIANWQSYLEALEPWLIPEQLQELLDRPETHSQELLRELTRDFDELVEMDALRNDFSAEELTATERICSLGMAMALKRDSDYVVLFDNSVRLAWIQLIEERYPVLKAVSSLKMQQLETTLQQGIIRKQELSGDIVRMKLKEYLYTDTEKNRLGNLVTYRELLHQVTKKRRIWPIRKLLETMGAEVFRLLPCWMTSPEAASAMFPMTAGLFDLVIFDEASQCYAEYALPAAYRGKQLVIAGDSKQLPPTDLYKIRFEEVLEETENVPVELEVESLLDLASQRLPACQLTGHYRSLSLDLIQFSNAHFYKNSLHLLPDFEYINRSEPGITYHKVNGIWEKGINRIEAQKVLELVRELQVTTRSVGIVTFNYPQQQLIEELLEAEQLVFPELFVKNIENVQGDERDVIIFSVGYASDAQGRLMMQFGSLNTQGGENRLNVAVTRARRKIHMVTSLWPLQLRTENSAHNGPRLLKAYLEYAHQVSDGKFLPQPLETPRHRSQLLLRDQLLDKIPYAGRELPFADLTLKTDQGYQGLILTDDDPYFYSTSAKEPHAYLPLSLRRKNWPFKRIYSREYWSGKEPVI